MYSIAKVKKTINLPPHPLSSVNLDLKIYAIMIPTDLMKEIKTRLKTIGGQLQGIVKMMEEEQSPEKILLQFKAAKKGLDKAHYQLLDDVYRKALAISIVNAVDGCPGNCGNEDRIEYIKQKFPDLKLDEISEKLQEMNEIENRLRQYNDEKNNSLNEKQ